MLKRAVPKVALARQFRKALTEPELLLWLLLKSRDDDLVFKRQKPFGPYILDFYCFAARLVIEIDGANHGEAQNLTKDLARDAYLTRNGLHVLRVDAGDVYEDAKTVADRIRALARELAGKRK